MELIDIEHPACVLCRKDLEARAFRDSTGALWHSDCLEEAARETLEHRREGESPGEITPATETEMQEPTESEEAIPEELDSSPEPPSTPVLSLAAMKLCSDCNKEYPATTDHFRPFKDGLGRKCRNCDKRGTKAETDTAEAEPDTEPVPSRSRAVEAARAATEQYRKQRDAAARKAEAIAVPLPTVPAYKTSTAPLLPHEAREWRKEIGATREQAAFAASILGRGVNEPAALRMERFEEDGDDLTPEENRRLRSALRTLEERGPKPLSQSDFARPTAIAGNLAKVA